MSQSAEMEPSRVGRVALGKGGRAPWPLWYQESDKVRSFSQHPLWEHWFPRIKARTSQHTEPVPRSALLHLFFPCSCSPTRAGGNSKDEKSCSDRAIACQLADFLLVPLVGVWLGLIPPADECLTFCWSGCLCISLYLGASHPEPRGAPRRQRRIRAVEGPG